VCRLVPIARSGGRTAVSWLLHVDLDLSVAAVELSRRPELPVRPLGVRTDLELTG